MFSKNMTIAGFDDALWQAIREFKQQHPRTGTVTP